MPKPKWKGFGSGSETRLPRVCAWGDRPEEAEGVGQAPVASFTGVFLRRLDEVRRKEDAVGEGAPAPCPFQRQPIACG